MVTIVFPVFQTVRGEEGCYSVKNTVAEGGDDRVFGISEHPRGCNSVKDGGWKVVTIVFSAFQSIRRKQGCNSIKNTVAESCDDRIFGVSDRP